MENSRRGDTPDEPGSTAGATEDAHCRQRDKLPSVLRKALWSSLVRTLPAGIVLAAIVCGVLWFVIAPSYRSHSTLRIAERQPYLAFPSDDEASPEFVQTQLELLRSPYVITRAMESESLGQLPELRMIAGREDAVTWIRRRLTVVRIGRSEIYEVAFVARSPESAHKVVEAIVTTYMTFQSSLRDQERQHTLEMLEGELNRVERKMNDRRAILRELVKGSMRENPNLAVPEEKDRADRPPAGRGALLTSLQQKLVDAEVEMETARARHGLAR